MSTRALLLAATILWSNAAQADQPATLIKRWYAAYTECFAFNDQRSRIGCETKENVGYALDAQNWCFGKRGQAGYQKVWHVCTRNSTRW